MDELTNETEFETQGQIPSPGSLSTSAITEIKESTCEWSQNFNIYLPCPYTVATVTLATGRLVTMMLLESINSRLVFLYLGEY